MGQALYRKYRSKSLDDVVGQTHITDTLKRAIASGRISHAYLFTGPRGVGKTSVARILAHQVNGLPYKDESMNLDIIEIDAASNNGVEDVRELRDKTHISPVSSEYKVYIIDEVHMLSKPAFNALLKTLEEPPAHVIFILATTEAHKLPETIVSRTQRFEFKPITTSSVVNHLDKIAKAEKIKIDKPALELLAEHGEGSFRDSISLLDQLASTGQAIEAETVRRMLGVPSATLVEGILNAVSTSRPAEVIENLSAMREQGVDAASAARSVAAKLRESLIGGQNDIWLPKLLRDLVDVPASRQSDISLEVSLLEAALAGSAFQPAKEPAPAKSKTSAFAAPTQAANSRPPQRAAARQLDSQSWDEILDIIKKKAASLYTALRLAQPSLSDSTLTLVFQFPLHQKKLEQAKNKDLVAKIVSDVLGKDIQIEATVSDVKVTEVEQDAPIKTISNIFGTSEVLES